MIFYRKPERVEVVHCNRIDKEELKNFLGYRFFTQLEGSGGREAFYLETIEGHKCRITKGDFVVKDSKGFFRVLNERRFKELYREDING